MADIIRILRGDGFGWLRMIWGDWRRRKVTMADVRRSKEKKRKAMRAALDVPAIMGHLEKMHELFESGLKPEQLAELRERRAREAEKAALNRDEVMEDFEGHALLEAFESLQSEIGWVLDRNREKLYEMALDLYYEGEEIMRNSEDEKGVAAYQDFREAMEKEWGGPLPPRAKH